jgi:hypothetical protein
MNKVVKLTESDLARLVKKVMSEQESANYMFFSNLVQIKRQCEIILEMDQHQVDEIINNGHDWADDHITEAKTNIDQVFDFLMNETKKEESYIDYEDIHEGKAKKLELIEIEKKNNPTNPKLWNKAKSMAESKYKTWPSPQATKFATKWYSTQGGKWKRK